MKFVDISSVFYVWFVFENEYVNFYYVFKGEENEIYYILVSFLNVCLCVFKISLVLDFIICWLDLLDKLSFLLVVILGCLIVFMLYILIFVFINIFNNMIISIYLI